MKLLIPIERLSDRPSYLIRGALLDMSECEKDKRYSVEDPDFWNLRWHQKHVRRSRHSHLGNVICNVCMAGAVMAKSCLAPYGETWTPDDFDEDTKKKLMALNELRQGDIHTALIHILELSNNPLEVERKITPYAENKKLFCRQMEILADNLEAHGL